MFLTILPQAFDALHMACSASVTASRRSNGVPDSWKVLFDSDEYKGRIAVLSEAGDMFRLYGKYMGKSVNALTDADIKTIEAMMRSSRSQASNPSMKITDRTFFEG